MSENQKNLLNAEAGDALFDGQIQGLALTCYQNERPPNGLAGKMDWYFKGMISQYIRQGAITGKMGECTYLPLSKNGFIFHLILIGAGSSPSPGKRDPVPFEGLKILQQNLISLKLPKMGISRSDF